MNRILLASLTGVVLAMGACEKSPSPGGTGSGAQTPPADNTGVNARDRTGDTKTPIDQGQGQSDVTIAAAIRRAIMDDASMSTNAQNCKVVVLNGAVTLRGPVNTQAEKDGIEAKAKAVTGVISVVNELEVKNS